MIRPALLFGALLPLWLGIAMAKTNPLRKVILLERADRIVRKGNIIDFYGHVSFFHGDNHVTGPHFVWDRENNIISSYAPFTVATDRRAIRIKSGFFSNATKNYTFKNAELIFDDHAFGRAERIYRVGKMIFYRRVFTTFCNLCLLSPKKGDAIPQFYTQTLTYNSETAKYIFKQNTLYISRWPIFYFPYFEAYGPKIKRHTGLVSPIFGYYTQLGFLAGLKFFVNLSPRQDLFFSVRSFSKVAPMLSGAYAISTPHVFISTSGSFIRTQSSLAPDVLKKNRFIANRWLAQNIAKFYLPLGLQFESHVSLVSDPNYLLDFPLYDAELENNRFLKSDMVLTRTSYSDIFNGTMTAYQTVATLPTGDRTTRLSATSHNYWIHYLDSFLGGKGTLIFNHRLNALNERAWNTSASATYLQHYTLYLGPSIVEAGGTLAQQIQFVVRSKRNEQTRQHEQTGATFYATHETLHASLYLPFVSFSSIGILTQGPKLYGIGVWNQGEERRFFAQPPTTTDFSSFFTNHTFDQRQIGEPRVDMGYFARTETTLTTGGESLGTNIFVGKSFFFHTISPQNFYSLDKKPHAPYFFDGSVHALGWSLTHLRYLSYDFSRTLRSNWQLTWHDPKIDLKAIYSHGHYLNTVTNTEYSTELEEGLAFTLQLHFSPHWTFAIDHIGNLRKDRAHITRLNLAFDNGCLLFRTSMHFSPFTPNDYGITFSLAIRPIITYNFGSGALLDEIGRLSSSPSQRGVESG